MKHKGPHHWYTNTPDPDHKRFPNYVWMNYKEERVRSELKKVGLKRGQKIRVLVNEGQPEPTCYEGDFKELDFTIPRNEMVRVKMHKHSSFHMWQGEKEISIFSWKIEEIETL